MSLVRATTLLLLMAIAIPVLPSNETQRPISIGSKSFNESHILAEITAQWLQHNGITVHRKLGLGGTLIAYAALRNGDIDLYPEYTGTLSAAIFKQDLDTPQALSAALQSADLQNAAMLGFNNSYAIAVSRETQRALQLTRLSQLHQHPDLSVSVSLEFLNRADGWPALSAAYNLPQTPTGIEHALAYRALAEGEIDVTDVYTTDGQLISLDLTLLEDDRNVFPLYEALLLARNDLPDSVTRLLRQLSGQINETDMQTLNAAAMSAEVNAATVADGFLRERGMIDEAAAPQVQASVSRQVLLHTLQHLKLTGIAMALALLLALPAAILISRHKPSANALLYVCGLLQTVPSLALLALLIPFLGLGVAPAVTALFVYSLLPIVRNTLAGLASVDPLLVDVAEGMGMTRRQQLLRIQLPLAAPMILSGIRIAAVISIGTATLAAFVGAGGLGEPIMTGLTLNDHRLILQGAIPAALLAISLELLFEQLEQRLIPAHLRG